MRLRHYVLAVLLALLALAGWLWLTMLSPYTYERPAHLPDIEPGQHAVFVYGTLRFAPVRWVVMGRAGETEPALLEGYRREGLDLSEAPGDRVEGEFIVVDADELARLDRYERLGIRYQRVPMRLADGRMAWVYRRIEATSQPATSSQPPERSGISTGGAVHGRLWPVQRPFYNMNQLSKDRGVSHGHYALSQSPLFQVAPGAGAAGRA